MIIGREFDDRDIAMVSKEHGCMAITVNSGVLLDSMDDDGQCIIFIREHEAKSLLNHFDQSESSPGRNDNIVRSIDRCDGSTPRNIRYSIVLDGDQLNLVSKNGKAVICVSSKILFDIAFQTNCEHELRDNASIVGRLLHG